MLKRQNQTNDQTSVDRSAPIATIINIQTEVPISCDQCDCDTHYSIGHLKALPTLTCEFCQDARNFTQLEMNVLESALQQMGFYLAGAKA